MSRGLATFRDVDSLGTELTRRRMRYGKVSTKGFVVCRRFLPVRLVAEDDSRRRQSRGFGNWVGR